MPKTFNMTDNEEKVDVVEEEPIAPIEPSKEEAKENTNEIQKDEITEIPKKKFDWKVLIFPIVAILTLSGIGVFYYFGIYKAQPIAPSDIISFNPNYISSVSPEKAFRNSLNLLSKPEEPKTEVSPLNGLLFTKTEMDNLKKKRPVAVITNNHADARPLSGLNSADIVIEANAESGITRHLAIYWSQAPKKVGPIRSLRQYYLEWLSEYDPILIHDGCASTDNVKTNACGNVYTYGTKDITTLGAWRVHTDGRVAPHNEYTSIPNALEYGEKMNWDEFPSSIQAWSFKRDAEIENRGKKTVVKTIFHQRLNNGGLYDAMWTYDQTTNSYFRKIGGQADMDLETNTQISAKNVVIQEVDMKISGDNKGRVIIDTIGEGDAVILQDGKIINGKWKKASRTDRTKYYDNAGNPIQFNRGRIWIAMLPNPDGKFDIIEQ